MSIVRSFFSAFDRMSSRMSGQDVERRNAVHKNRAGGDFAAISQVHGSQGITKLGLNR